MIYRLFILVGFLYGVYSFFLITNTTEYMLIFLILFSNAIMLFSYYYLSLTDRTKYWSSVIGNVLNFFIEEEPHYEDTGKIILYYPSIRYEYIVNDKRYISELMSFDKKSTKYKNKDELTRFINKLINVKDVNVYYNPKKPSKSILIKSLSKDRYKHFNVLFISGAIIIILEAFIKFLLF